MMNFLYLVRPASTVEEFDSAATEVREGCSRA